jgi:hypothetical protein
MKTSKPLIVLSYLVAAIAALASGAGLFWPGGPGPFEFTTLHGEVVEIYGRGLYALDTAFKAPILRGADAILLFVGVPALLVAIQRYRRGTRVGKLLLAGILACFLYNAISVAMGIAYNPIFLLYIAYVGTSLYAFILAFSAIDVEVLPKPTRHRGTAIFIFIAGLSTSVWLIEIIAGLLGGHMPTNLDHYTTDVTAVIDVGVILPTCWLAGVLLLRRKRWGYPVASTMLILLVLIGLIVASQTVMQILDGIVLRPGEIAAYVAPFVSLSVIAIWLEARLLRTVQAA